MKRLIFAIAAILTAGCSPKRDSIPIYWEQTPTQASIAANLHASDIGGKAYKVAPTGSMEPLITAGDWVVITPIQWSDVRVGIIALFQPRWKPDGAQAIHWVAAKHGDEWIMDGQANGRYEKSDKERMGIAEFRNGKVIAIYTERKKD